MIPLECTFGTRFHYMICVENSYFIVLRGKIRGSIRHKERALFNPSILWYSYSCVNGVVPSACLVLGKLESSFNSLNITPHPFRPSWLSVCLTESVRVCVRACVRVCVVPFSGLIRLFSSSNECLAIPQRSTSHNGGITLLVGFPFQSAVHPHESHHGEQDLFAGSVHGGDCH